MHLLVPSWCCIFYHTHWLPRGFSFGERPVPFALFLPELFPLLLHVLIIWFCQFWAARPKQASDKVEAGSKTTGRASSVSMFSWLHPSEWHTDSDTGKLRYKTRYSGWSFLSFHFNITSAKKKLRRCQNILLVAYNTTSRCQVLNRPQFRQRYTVALIAYIFLYPALFTSDLEWVWYSVKGLSIFKCTNVHT